MVLLVSIAWLLAHTHVSTRNCCKSNITHGHCTRFDLFSSFINGNSLYMIVYEIFIPCYVHTFLLSVCRFMAQRNTFYWNWLVYSVCFAFSTYKQWSLRLCEYSWNFNTSKRKRKSLFQFHSIPLNSIHLTQWTLFFGFGWLQRAGQWTHLLCYVLTFHYKMHFTQKKAKIESERNYIINQFFVPLIVRDYSVIFFRISFSFSIFFGILLQISFNRINGFEVLQIITTQRVLILTSSFHCSSFAVPNYSKLKKENKN